jgi:hypothetical protein
MPSFDISESAKVAAWTKEGLDKAVRRGLISTGYRVVQEITTNFIPNSNPPPVLDGIFRAGWHVDETSDPIAVVNNVPYAVIIDKGARAENIKIGRNMIEALTEWVIKKGFVGRRARAGSTARAEQDTNARNTAWAIAVSMKKKGIFDKGNGLRISEKAQAFAAKIVNEEVAREINKGIDH